MKTYQDLLNVSEIDKSNFILDAIAEHKGSEMYRTANIALLYYRELNPTIMAYEKTIHDMKGMPHIDKWSPNHKISSNFFRFAIQQENQYLLGNGVSFKDEATKAMLGDDFDSKVQRAGSDALWGGVSFGFWNLDHLDVFSVLEFVPLYDEENGSLRAGIRFWQIADDKPLRATLYEEDGYTEYIKGKSSSVLTEMKPKTSYKLTIARTAVDDETIVDGENYHGFPIVPLYANEFHQSELVGKRGLLDAYDLLTSNLVNNVDEGNLIYWVIKNAGGMDINDDEKFLEQLHTTHITHLEDDQDVTAQTLEVPYARNSVGLETLKKQLYDDFMCFNVAEITAGQKTATEIRARYQLLDSKVDGYEYQVIDFVKGILELAGIDDDPTFTRSRIVNNTEEIQTLLQTGQYIDGETITRRIAELLGMGDRVEDILNNIVNDESAMFTRG